MNKLLFILYSSLFIFSCVKRDCAPISTAPVKDTTTVTKTVTDTSNTNTNPADPCSHLVTTWAAEKTVSPNSISGSYFLNESIGWLCGANGTILKTTDGGQTFIAQNSTTAQLICQIQFIDENLGYAIGGNSDPLGVILKTTDGGTTWTIILNNILSCRGIYFINSTTGFVGCSSGFLIKTTDGGATWNTVNAGIGGTIYDIQFVDNTNGYLAGAEGQIYKTVDEGSTWTSLSNTMPKGLNDAFFGIDFIDKDNGYVCGYSLAAGHGYLIKTTDGGANWTYLTTPSFNLVSIKMIDMNTGYAVGGPNGSTGVIIKITNGNSWSIEKTLSHQQRSISLYGCNNAITAGINGMAALGE